MALNFALQSQVNSLKRKLAESEKASKEAHEELHNIKDKVDIVCKTSHYCMEEVPKELK